MEQLEKKAEQEEQLLANRSKKTSDVFFDQERLEKYSEVNDIYIQSIKAKLSILD